MKARLPRLYRSLTAAVEMIKLNGCIYSRTIGRKGKWRVIDCCPHGRGTEKARFWESCLEACRTQTNGNHHRAKWPSETNRGFALEHFREYRELKREAFRCFREELEDLPC